ncbi:transporter substrate-binding domain-containing protein [Vibrio sp. T187]|uniref:substrate-binding periplasmic protein n=1 Tax=Vibrio TaxID=662 RepID=UPI0010C9CE65|nr:MULTISPECIES: transporter substrate-binding domain-containing protein [Vibrio]MBW3696843.1 transporter substrate-binding domain-containing protein [Vibrio sp. T187]
MMKLLCYALFIFFSTFTYSQQVVIATHNLSPYGSFPVGSPVKKIATEDFTGFAVDRVRCAFKTMEVGVQILVVPWSRAQIMAESDEVDGFFAGSQNKYRDTYASKTDVIAEQKWQWYWLKSNPQNVENFDSMTRIGAFQGSNMSKWLEDNGYPIYSRPTTTEQLLLQLKNNRIDVFIANNLVAAKLIETHGMSDMIDSALVKDKPLYLYLTKRSLAKMPQLLPEFNHALKRCYELENQ